MTTSRKSERGAKSSTGSIAHEVSIQVRGVSKNFGVRKAVDHLSFEVNLGEVVGFLGPNGAGKTTTMRMLTSYYTPDSGTILINGIDNQEQDMVTRNRIGYLPESNPLYYDLLVGEYLDFVADLRQSPKNDRKRNTDMAVEEAGLSEVYYRPINQLSKGYKQRVGLAQAILHRPPILILDEPTEGLDPNQRMSIRELIRELGRERTVLLSTHVMQEVESTCERVLVISRGKLVADSPVQELLSHSGGVRTINIEVEGDRIEAGLATVQGISNVERRDPVGNRKRYLVSIKGDADPRAEIFQVAKKRDWVLWDLHEDSARLEDVFHALTAEDQDED
jgi:ABC-2 type transport system ATP-binding protein